MALFPEMSSVEYARPLKVEIQHKTLVSTFDDLGVEKRKQKWLYPKRTVTLGFNHITKAKMQIVFAFYIARSGSYEAFNFFMPTLNANPYTYVGEYVGTGDGSTTVFNLPCRTSSGRTLYLDAAAQSDGGVDYTFAALGGADGADKVTFTAAPDSGARITLDFTGYLKIHCRFADDNLGWEELYDQLANSQLKLQGLLNE